MVIPPPVRPARISQYLKPYVLRMHFTNKYVSAQVVHTPTATVASSASSEEKQLRRAMKNTRDVAAAAKIGKLLGERLMLKGIPAVCVFLKREQKYHGKVKAVVDSVREAGVKLLLFKAKGGGNRTLTCLIAGMSVGQSTQCNRWALTPLAFLSHNRANRLEYRNRPFGLAR